MANKKWLKVIDYDAVRDAFEEEYKKTRKLIESGETHLDNLAEGFTEADRVLRKMLNVDAVEVVRKPVKGYEGYYEVDQFGRVFGLERIIKVNDNGRNYEKPIAGKQLKQSMHTKGYKTVSLTKDGKTKTLFVHRLVAEAFIPNVDNLPMVNHKDEDKTNNFVENLEWCTNDYNINYGTARKRQAKKIRGIPHTDEHKKKISESMKAYREKEKSENGYCYNGRGERKDCDD